MAQTSQEPIRHRIGIVGVCGAGKSTLAHALQAQGYDARQVSQEHSYVRDLWRRFSRCEIVIYLEASLGTARRRLQSPGWQDFLYEDQRERVHYAREHCDLCIFTDDLTPEQVLACALAMLAARGVAPAKT